MASRALERRRLDGDCTRPAFSCGHTDLDDFFHNDSRAGCKELLSATYAMMDGGACAAFFSVSNDSIKRVESASPFDRFLHRIPKEQQHPSIPAVKIGRLGVMRENQRIGYGTQVMNFLKVWFTHENKTGCRLLLVDAYNEERAINFYLKNGFVFYTGSDVKARTRTMYYDLLPFVQGTPAP